MNAQRSIKRHLTVRDLPPEVAEALEDEKRRRGTSLNRTVIDLLAQGLGVTSAGRRSNGLARLAGTWTAAELARFEEAVAPAEGIDEELWR
jgi:hypothetical protein